MLICLHLFNMPVLLNETWQEAMSSFLINMIKKLLKMFSH